MVSFLILEVLVYNSSRSCIPYNSPIHYAVSNATCAIPMQLHELSIQAGMSITSPWEVGCAGYKSFRFPALQRRASSSVGRALHSHDVIFEEVNGSIPLSSKLFAFGLCFSFHFAFLTPPSRQLLLSASANVCHGLEKPQQA